MFVQPTFLKLSEHIRFEGPAGRRFRVIVMQLGRPSQTVADATTVLMRANQPCRFFHER